MTDRAPEGEEFAQRLLAPLREQAPETPVDLHRRTLGRVRLWIAARDVIELATSGFVRGFLAPLADRVAAALAARKPRKHGDSPRAEAVRHEGSDRDT